MQKNFLNFPVERTSDLFGADTTLASHLKARRLLLVADQNVVHRIEGLGTRIGHYLQNNGLELACAPLVLAGGEKVKQGGLENAHRLLSALVENRLGAKDAVLVLGGGALLDVAGYAVGQLRENPGLFRIPTTPAALLAAAFAESARIYFKNEKDALSVPVRPTAVILDTSLAKTVLDGVWRGGFGEAVRQAFLSGDSSLLKTLVAETEGYRNRSLPSLDAILDATVASRRKKGSSQRLDELVLTLERNSTYKLPFGYAVAIATFLAAEYDCLNGDLKRKDADLMAHALTRSGALEALQHSRYLLTNPAGLATALTNADGAPVDPAPFAEACAHVLSSEAAAH